VIEISSAAGDFGIADDLQITDAMPAEITEIVIMENVGFTDVTLEGGVITGTVSVFSPGDVARVVIMGTIR